MIKQQIALIHDLDCCHVIAMLKDVSVSLNLDLHNAPAGATEELQP
jgi:hypothetical protein